MGYELETWQPADNLQSLCTLGAERVCFKGGGFYSNESHASLDSYFMHRKNYSEEINT